MRDRITRLNQIQATIYVGGMSETEQGEERDHIVDALNSARSALEFGVLPGGGSAMYHASKLLPIYTEVDHFEEMTGLKIFQETMQQPIRHIIGNSQGEEKVGYILENISKEGIFIYYHFKFR